MKNGMDLVVSFDTTGSMFPVLAQVRQKVSSFVGDMFKSIEDLRVGIIAHGDYYDKDNPYTIRIMDFTKDEKKITEFIKTTKQTCGGDADECYELVLNNARTTMSWEAGRLKIFVVIGDASPHGVNYPDNKGRIDWKNEAGLLNDLGVKIFAVHALSYYRSSSQAFYETIARVTDGKYLKLDQFDEVVDLIMATCMSEYGEERLNEFVSVIRSSGKLTRTMAQNISRLSGKTLMAEGKPVQRDGLISVVPGRFQVMTLDEDCAIKVFVENNGITFKRGRGFYELTKHETVQQYKEVIIQDRVTGEMFTGAEVREKLGLSPQIEKGGVKESLSSRSTAEFRVFVQSTSFNRKLIAGTAFLYEITDMDDTGTKIADIDCKVAKVPMAEDEKKAFKEKRKKVAKESSIKKETVSTEDKLPDLDTKSKKKLPPLPEEVTSYISDKAPIEEDKKEPVKKAPTKKASTKKASTKAPDKAEDKKAEDKVKLFTAEINSISDLCKALKENDMCSAKLAKALEVVRAEMEKLK